MHLNVIRVVLTLLDIFFLLLSVCHLFLFIICVHSTSFDYYFFTLHSFYNNVEISLSLSRSCSPWLRRAQAAFSAILIFQFACSGVQNSIESNCLQRLNNSDLYVCTVTLVINHNLVIDGPNSQSLDVQQTQYKNGRKNKEMIRSPCSDSSQAQILNVVKDLIDPNNTIPSLYLQLIFLIYIAQNQIRQASASSMTNRNLKIDLPPSSSHQPERESATNIQMGRQTPHDAISRGYKKWAINESYVERRISHKKHRLLKPLEHFSTPKAYHPMLQTPDKNMFFTGVSLTQEKNSLGKEQLRNLSIEKSKKFVQIVKSHRKKLIKIRMVTEPNHTKLPLSPQSPKQEEPHQLFNYLRRSFINHKKHNINDTVIETFKKQSPESIFEKISEKSRKFLLQKMQKDYKNYVQIDNYKQQQIKHLIQQQIQKKKKLFRSDYNKRYSSPYYSFLSLNKEEKANILKRQDLASLHSV